MRLQDGERDEGRGEFLEALGLRRGPSRARERRVKRSVGPGCGTSSPRCVSRSGTSPRAGADSWLGVKFVAPSSAIRRPCHEPACAPPAASARPAGQDRASPRAARRLPATTGAAAMRGCGRREPLDGSVRTSCAACSDTVCSETPRSTRPPVLLIEASASVAGVPSTRCVAERGRVRSQRTGGVEEHQAIDRGGNRDLEPVHGQEVPVGERPLSAPCSSSIVRDRWPEQ